MGKPVSKKLMKTQNILNVPEIWLEGYQFIYSITMNFHFPLRETTVYRISAHSSVIFRFPEETEAKRDKLDYEG